MLKLLICLFCSFALGLAMLQLRQQQIELRHRTTQLQGQIEAQQAKLWSQQLQIAIATAPEAVAGSIKEANLALTNEANLPEGAGNWIDRPVPQKKP